MIRFLAVGVLSLCAAAPVLAGSPALHSGKYEGLMLAVTPEHQVEGYYAEEMGEGVTRSCTFYLQGKPSALTTWNDTAYPGSVAPSSDGVTLTVAEGRQHPGCLNVLMPEIATGLVFVGRDDHALVAVGTQALAVLAQLLLAFQRQARGVDDKACDHDKGQGRRRGKAKRQEHRHHDRCEDQRRAVIGK